MNQYIKDLTNYLIGQNGFDRLAGKFPNREELVNFIQIDLEAGNVARMNPPKLGEVICSFGIGEVMATKQELMSHVHFSGDCEDLVRALVARCLAFVIADRLVHAKNVDPYPECGEKCTQCASA